MTTLERCIESLAFCHVQDEPHWPAARVVAQQDIDEYLREAGPDAANRSRALTQLMTEFAGRCPGELDPVLIRSYMRRQLRRIGYDLQRREEDGESEIVTEEVAPATAPAEAERQTEAASEDAVSDQPSDIERAEADPTSRKD
jgi:hypothetical protein